MKAYFVVSCLVAIFGFFFYVEADATMGNIVISKGYINQLCTDSCRQSTVREYFLSIHHALLLGA
jgi:hypothetical protein